MNNLIKPRRLKNGDTVAVVSLSWGGLGDREFIHKYDIARERLECDFGLKVLPMPHALKGSEFVAAHPELRAKDLMDAFLNPEVAGIFCAIGGDDSIRILPFIDYDIIRKHPKIFMGYSDTTISHFIMHKAGLVSFYGPSVMAEFGEYVEMFSYTEKAVHDVVFQDSRGYRMESSPLWSDDYVGWSEENRNRKKVLKPDEYGYEILQGSGIVTGHLLGGCLDVFMMAAGTTVWPPLSDWQGAVLFLETSEDKPSPDFVKWMLRNLAAQGILKELKGILVGKPQAETYYEEYKEVYRQVTAVEEGLTELPILYNVNFGHASPIGVIPVGIEIELNCDEKTITFLESAVV